MRRSLRFAPDRRGHRERRRIVGQRDDQGAGARETRAIENFRAAGVAEQHRHTELVQSRQASRIGLDDEPRNLQASQRLGDVTAHAAAADDDDVLVEHPGSDSATRSAHD